MKKIIATLTTIALAGCGSKIDCNDSNLKQIAIQLIQDRMEQAVWYREIKAALTLPSLVDIQTIRKNEETKQSTCRANYSFQYNGKQRNVPVEYSLSYLEDSGNTQVALDPDVILRALMVLVMVEQPIVRQENDVARAASPLIPVSPPPDASPKKEVQSDEEPNGENEANNKRQGKPWQDTNGIIHNPDGTTSGRPVD